MNIFAHLALGLIIGKLTGNYPAAILGSIAIDIDHFIVFFKYKVFKNIKKTIAFFVEEKDPYNGQRGYLHNVFALALISLILWLINSSFGLIFFLAYAGHLFFDAIDTADFYPFYTRKVNIRGFIGYFSKIEWEITATLFVIYAILFFL